MCAQSLNCTKCINIFIFTLIILLIFCYEYFCIIGSNTDLMYPIWDIITISRNQLHISKY